MCPTEAFWDSTNLDDLTDYKRGEKSKRRLKNECLDEGHLIA